MIEINKKTLFRIFGVVAGCIVLYWLLHETERVSIFFQSIREMFSPFITGAAIAFIINVPMRAIERQLKGVKSQSARRGISIVATLLVLILVLTLVFWLLIPQLVRTFESLMPQVYDFFIELGNHVEDFLRKNPKISDWVMANTELENLNWPVLVQNFVSMLGKSFSAIASQTVNAIGSVTGAIFNLVIALVFAIYCLFQKETLARQGRKLVYAFLPERAADKTVQILRLSNSTFSNFLSGQCIEVCILGAMFAVSMLVFRMPYVALVSVLVAITAFIPVVGAWMGCILGAFLILVDDAMLAVWFVLMFLVIQQIEGNLIYPRVVGTSIGLSGMWVLMAVAVGGKLMGIAGMFLMIPAASVLYTLLKECTQGRLEKRSVAPEKLIPQPPELNSRFKEKREASKQKRNIIKKK